MSIQTNCPGCRAPFTLAESMVGKKIRCGKCHEVFPVKATPMKRRLDDDDVEEAEVAELEEPRGRIKAAPASPVRSVTTKRRGGADEPVLRGLIAPPKNNMPMLVGGGVACVAMLVGGAIVVALLMRGDSAKQSAAAVDTKQADKPVIAPAERPPINMNPAGAPPVQADVKPPPPTDVKPPPVEEVKPPPPADSGRRGELSQEALELAKRATVLIHVTLPDDGKVSGTGFFAAPDSPSMIVTNAHVVGMLSPGARKPKNIEVVLNSGMPDMKKVTATILGVDRGSDLAVLDVGSNTGLPKPLNVRSGADLRLFQDLFIFGFPFGEAIGKEISANKTSITSLRHKGGILDRIQVGGGMLPGNSGGPVVDDTGHVVGVAVSGIKNTNINFAIPGNRVEAILNGRVTETLQGQPYKATGDNIGLPLTLTMTDPRNRVKDVWLDVWVGNPPSEKEPVRPPTYNVKDGDSPKRDRTPLKFVGGVGKADVMLPPKPDNKVWWVQASWTTTTGKTYWDYATHYKAVSPPVERRPAQLFANYRTRQRRVDIETTTRMLIGAEADTEVISIANKASLFEQGAASAGGTVMRLTYRNCDETWMVLKRKFPMPHVDLAKANLKFLVGVVELDGAGNLRENSVQDENALIANKPIGEALLRVHQPIRFALFPMLLGMPAKQVQAGETWKTTRQVAVQTLGDLQVGNIDLSYTYLGVRTIGGRQEAVINIDGVIKEQGMSGRARGSAILDLTSSVIKKVEFEFEVDMPPVELIYQDNTREKVRVLSVVSMKLERNL